MSVKVTRDEVIAYRLEAQNLNRRLDKRSLVAATGVCGVQNSPPGSALLALNARVSDVAREAVNTAISKDKSLLQSWSMRGAPFFFPTSDLPVFTTGVLPPTEDGRRHLILGVVASLEKLEMSLAEVVDRTRDTIGSVLSGHRLTVNDLGAEMTELIARELPKKKRADWEREGPYAKGQPLGEGVVHFCLRILTLQQVICFAPRDGKRHRSCCSMNGWTQTFPTWLRRTLGLSSSGATCMPMGRPRAETSPRGSVCVREKARRGGTCSRTR